MFVVQQTGTAYKLDGHALILALTTILDGHGGISSIQYTPPVSPSLTGTMVITMADQSTTSVNIQNGKGITGIAKASTSGLVDTYRISYNDGTSSTFTVTNGAKGDTGQAWYVWIRYAGQQPTSDADIGTNPDDWMGIYSGMSSTAPTHYTSYQWFQIKGEKGDTGDTGASIASVVRTSGDGSPGTYDVYTVTLDNGTVAGTFTVYNGLNGEGAVGSVNNVQPDSGGNVSLAASDIPTSSSSTVQATLSDLSSNKQNRITANGMLKGNGTSVLAATLGSDYTAVDDTLSSSSVKTYSINKIKSLTPTGLVSYAQAQTLTAAQQKQARDNIGADWVLLWQNASPTSTFSPQTISVALAGYDFFAVAALSEKASAQEMQISIIDKSASYSGSYISTDRTWTNGGGIYQRFFNYTDTTIAWESGRRLTFQTPNSVSYATGDDYIIPQKIYGLKRR